MIEYTAKYKEISKRPKLIVAEESPCKEEKYCKKIYVSE